MVRTGARKLWEVAERSVRQKIVGADEERACGKNSRGHSKQDLSWLLTGCAISARLWKRDSNKPAFQRLETFCLQPMSRRGSFGKLWGHCRIATIQQYHSTFLMSTYRSMGTEAAV